MQRPALLSLAVAAALCAGSGSSWAVEGCLSRIDPESSLNRVPDCMRMGRHVRVDSNVSRGTATLRDGMMPTTLRDGSADMEQQRRLRVPVAPGGSLWSGFFGR